MGDSTSTEHGSDPELEYFTADGIDDAYGSLLRRLDQVQNPVVRAWLILRFLGRRKPGILGFHVYEQDLCPRLAAEALREEFDTGDRRIRGALLAELRHYQDRPGSPDQGQLTLACARLEALDAANGCNEGILGPHVAEVKIAAAHVEEVAGKSQDRHSALGLVVTIRMEIVPPPARPAPPAWDHPLAGYSDGPLRSLAAVTRDATEAVIRTLSASAPRFRAFGRRQWSQDSLSVPVRLGVPETEILVAGDSAGLGLGVLLLSTEWSLRSGVREGRRPSSKWAWTGVLALDGAVCAIDSRHLAAKVLAAEGSGLAGIVVPMNQVSEAQAAIPEQARRTFRVLGVGHLQETLDEPDLWEPWDVRAWLERQTRRRRWRQVISLTVLFAAAALLSRLIPLPPPLRGADPVPRIESRRMEIVVPAGSDFRGRHVQGDGPYSNAVISRHAWGLREGTPVLVYTSAVGPGGDGVLMAMNLKTGKPLWRFELHPTDLPLPADRSRSGTFVNPLARTLHVTNMDKDPEDEIVFSLSLHPYSSCFVVLLDPGAPLRAAFHPGHLEALSIGDLDGDGLPEIAAAGHHNPSGGMALLVLRPADMRACPGIGLPGIADIPGGSVPEGRSTAGFHHEKAADSVALHVVVPLPMEARRGLGLTELRYDTLEVRQQAPGEAMFQLDIGFEPGGTCPDFMIQVQTWPLVTSGGSSLHGGHEDPIRIVANACLGPHMQAWRGAGRVVGDFTSPRFLSDWRADFQLSRSLIQ